MSPAGRMVSGAARAGEQHAVGQPAPARVAGQEEALVRHAEVAQGLVDGDGVLLPGGVGELGRQAVVGHEDGAVGLLAHPRGEERVHLGGRADVAAAVEVEDHADGLAGAGPVEDAGHAAQHGGVALDVEGAHDGRHDDLADVIEHELDAAELGDGQRRRVAHEAADHLAGDADAEVGRRVGAALAHGATEGDPEQGGPELLGQEGHVEGGDRGLGRLHLGPVAHCHGASVGGAAVPPASRPPGRSTRRSTRGWTPRRRPVPTLDP